MDEKCIICKRDLEVGDYFIANRNVCEPCFEMFEDELLSAKEAVLNRWENQVKKKDAEI